MSRGIQIYLKHFNDREGKFAPRTNVCRTDEARGLVGCGQTIHRFVTYPKERGIYFDGAPVIVEQFPVRQDGAVIALVATDNVHFATCPARKAAAKATAERDELDGKLAGVGGRP